MQFLTGLKSKTRSSLDASRTVDVAAWNLGVMVKIWMADAVYISLSYHFMGIHSVYDAV